MNELFIAILNMSAKASIAALVLIIIRLLLKKAPKKYFCLLWGLVAIRLVCPVTIESSLSAFNLLKTSANQETTAFLEYNKTTDLAMEEFETEVSQSIIDSDNARNEITGTEDFYTQSDFSNDFQQNNERLTNSKSYFGPVITLWIIGILAMFSYALYSYLLVKRKVASSIYVNGNIYKCDYIDTPFILGIIKPRIYVPSSIEPTVEENVVAHEKAHIYRLDYIWKPLAFILLSVHWFNPFIWLAFALFSKDIELACDERVIKDMDKEQIKAYSRALLECSVSRKMISASPLAFGEVSVKQRVKSILDYKKPSFWIILSALIVSIIFVVLFFTDSKREEKISLNKEFVELSNICREGDYSNFKEIYTSSAKYYHGVRFIADIPDLNFQVVFEGEHGGSLNPVLKEESKAIYISGKLSNMFTQKDNEISFVNIMSLFNVMDMEVRAGNDTPYYVSKSEFVRFICDMDQDGVLDSYLEISNENKIINEEDAKAGLDISIDGNVDAWFMWVNPAEVPSLTYEDAQKFSYDYLSQGLGINDNPEKIWTEEQASSRASYLITYFDFANNGDYKIWIELQSGEIVCVEQFPEKWFEGDYTVGYEMDNETKSVQDIINRATEYISLLGISANEIREENISEHNSIILKKIVGEGMEVLVDYYQINFEYDNGSSGTIALLKSDLSVLKIWLNNTFGNMGSSYYAAGNMVTQDSIGKKLPDILLMSDHNSSKLDGDVTLAGYVDDLIFNFAGCLFENANYVEPKHASGVPAAWYSLGGVGECIDNNYKDRELFYNGNLIAYDWLDNHSVRKSLNVFSVAEYSACLYQYSFGLTTGAQNALGETDVNEMDYWVVFFTEGIDKPLYMKFFNCNYYTQEDAVESIVPGRAIIFNEEALKTDVMRAEDGAVITYGYISGVDDNIISFDDFKWINTDDMESYSLSEEQMPSGFYIYNGREKSVDYGLSPQCVYSVLDWEEGYQQKNISYNQFKQLLNDRGETNQFIPYIFTQENDTITSVTEQYVP